MHEMATIRRVVDQVRVRLAAGDGVRRGRIVRAASAPAPHPQHHILSARPDGLRFRLSASHGLGDVRELAEAVADVVGDDVARATATAKL